LKIFADFHIHSKYARATSPQMDLENISKFGKLKGLNLIGTGDFTHPDWLKELKQKLNPIEDTGIYFYNGMKFMLTTEISTIYEQNNKTRKIHHVVHVPNFEIIDQIRDILENKGAKLGIDGRLTLNNIASDEFVELLRNVYKDILIIPAHAWTPWYGVLGSKSGFDRIEDCYKDQTKYIYGLETGLSSDPAMNWRLSSLDKFTLMSNSDSHSHWPWRLGRECNVFEIDRLTYSEIFNIIKNKDKKKFLFTIEVDPAYGKYHWTGHRNCHVMLPPKKAMKINNICPKCKRPLTIGVEQRVEKLADRPEGYKPKNAIPFKKLIPLAELIKVVFKIDTLYSKTIWSEYMKLINKFGSEFKVLLETPIEELKKETNEKLAKFIILNREEKIKIIPGYDGVYGIPVFDENKFKEFKQKQDNIKLETQKTLKNF